MKRLHTLMFFLAVLFTGVSATVDAATVQQAFKCDTSAHSGQLGVCLVMNQLYEGDATFKAAIDKALNPVGLKDMFGADGYMDGPGGGVTPVTVNGIVWLEGSSCKANACGWDYIVTLYNPKTHKVVGYYYNIDPGYLIWFGEIGIHEFAYLVKDYVNKTN
ncbi:hypothetical protein EA432_25465 [Escherichia coli]|nr:hypothetical protein [Escherichia coli]KAA2069965.1 hypothetical protein EA432_25465 [Escherichia coli]HAK9584675.1 hypothetical protein [Escherichia coli]